MNADLILKSDLIDLVFESRNKEYGAYELRKLYHKHLLTAICGPIVILIFSWWFVADAGNTIQQAIIPKLPPDTIVHIIQPPPPLPPMPVARNVRKPRSADILFNTPVITPDSVTDVPEIGDLQHAIIGTKTNDPVGEPSPPVEPVIETAVEVTPISELSVYKSVEKMPEFPGGLHALSRFLTKHLKVPEEIDEPGTRVRILVHFVVDRDGSLKSVQCNDSIPAVYEKEIRRVFAKMPKWNPGSQHGKLVSVYYDLPIIFEIPEQ